MHSWELGKKVLCKGEVKSNFLTWHLKIPPNTFNDRMKNITSSTTLLIIILNILAQVVSEKKKWHWKKKNPVSIWRYDCIPTKPQRIKRQSWEWRQFSYLYLTNTEEIHKNNYILLYHPLSIGNARFRKCSMLLQMPPFSPLPSLPTILWSMGYAYICILVDLFLPPPFHLRILSLLIASMSILFVSLEMHILNVPPTVIMAVRLCRKMPFSKKHVTMSAT